MKTLRIVPTTMILALSTALLVGCGSYRKAQTAEEMSGPCDCQGLHLRHAQWHYTETDGYQLDVDGDCHKGMKHGQFHFYNKGILIAKSKFTRDAEVKTTCVGMPKGSKVTLAQCLDKARGIH